MQGLLCAGLLVREIGALAATCPRFGSRLCGGLWKQRPGLFLCEAAIRERCCGAEATRQAMQMPTHCSVGQHLVDLAFPTAGLEIVDGVLWGWGTADGKTRRLVVPRDVTRIAVQALVKSSGITALILPQGLTIDWERCIHGL